MAHKRTKADKVRAKLRGLLPQQPHITQAEFIEATGIQVTTDFYRLKRQVAAELNAAPVLLPTLQSLPQISDLLVQLMTTEGMTLFTINLEKRPHIEYRRTVSEVIELNVPKE